jgi:hypothetical protein
MSKNGIIIGSGLNGREVIVHGHISIENGFVAQADYNKGITIKSIENGSDLFCASKSEHHTIPCKGTWEEHWQWIRKCIMEKGIISARDEVLVFGLKEGARSNFSTNKIMCAF